MSKKASPHICAILCEVVIVINPLVDITPGAVETRFPVATFLVKVASTIAYHFCLSKFTLHNDTSISPMPIHQKQDVDGWNKVEFKY